MSSQNAVFNVDVVVVGSGIAGIAVALKLARLGIPVTLLTKAHDLSETSSALGPGWHYLSVAG